MPDELSRYQQHCREVCPDGCGRGMRIFVVDWKRVHQIAPNDIPCHVTMDRDEFYESESRRADVAEALASAAIQGQNELAELREQLAALRNSVLNQAGDDACWIPDPEHAQLPPKEEFLKSCERFHAQRTAQDGTLSGCMTIAQLEQQLAAKDAEITGLEETLFRTENKRLQLSRENERLRAALKAADRELINAVCDGAYYKPDETRMKIFRDGLREALAATPPANTCKDCGVILPCRVFEHREGCSLAEAPLAKEERLPSIEEMSGLVEDFTGGMPLKEYLDEIRGKQDTPPAKEGK